MALKIQDITYDEAGKLRLSAAELKTLYELGVTISDTETTGLKAGEAGLTEFASIRAVKLKKGKPPYRLELLHHYVLPLKPEFQDYLEACDEARINGEPEPVYDRDRYEYTIAPQALAVTGTEFHRDRPDGPITSMSVMGKKVEALPFYKLWRITDAPTDISRFIRNGDKDVYFNTPFDKPFLREMIKDAEAYELATTHAYTHEEAEDGDPDLIYEQIVGNEETRYLADIAYTEATEDERSHILDAIRSHLLLDENIENSARYQCLMHGFMQARSADGPRNLDAAFRTMVDKNFDGREEHSAIEDICMAARVACALAPRFDGTIPSMLDLYERLAHNVDPNAIVRLAPGRHVGKPVRFLQGDIEIQFSADPATLGPRAQNTWRFLQAFDEASRRNSRAPDHILSLNPHDHRVVISAERASPLSLSLLRKWMLFAQLQDSPLFDGFYPFDSTGVRADVALKPVRKGEAERLIEDVPLQSMRANRQWLEANPTLAVQVLELLRDLHGANERIGTVLLRGTIKDGVRIVFKGHQRGFGDVTLQLPAGQNPALYREQIIEQLDPLAKLGLVPYVSSLQQGDAAENSDDDDATPTKKTAQEASSTIALASRHIHLQLPDKIMRLMLLRLPKNSIRWEDAQQTIVTLGGDSLSVEHKDGMWHLRGTLDALSDFVVIPAGEDVTAATGRPADMSEKPGGLMRDASWLMYRLGQIPGTYDVSVDAQGGVTLHQKDGTSLEALNLLYRAGLPFKAYAYHIRLDGAQLMRDAFYWSLHLSRMQEDLTQDRARDIADRRHAPRPFLVSIHQALLQQKVGALRVDDLKQCWVSDTQNNPDGDERYHLVNLRDSYHSYEAQEGKVNPIRSPIAGVQHVEIIERDGQQFAVTSPVVLAVWNAWRAAHGKPGCTINLQGASQVEIPIADVDAQSMIDGLIHVASRLYQLYGVTGIERMPAADLRLDGSHKHLCFNLPSGQILEHSGHLLQDLISAYADIASSSFDVLSKKLRHQLPDCTDTRPRHANLALLCDQLGRKADPADKQDGLHNLQEMEGLLTFLLSRLGGDEFTDIPQSLSYSRQIENDLGMLGFLTHELSRMIGHTDPASAEHKALTASLTQVRTAHEKLFCFHTASERLIEATSVLRKALAGDHPRSLLRSYAQAQTYLALDHVLAMPSTSFKSLPKLEEAMAPYEASLKKLWQAAYNDDKEKMTPHQQRIYHDLVYSHLRTIREHGEVTAKDMVLLRLLRRRSDLSFTDEQMQAVAALYAAPLPASSVDAAREALKACFDEAEKPGIDQLILQRQLQEDPYLDPPEAATLQSDIEDKINKAYVSRGMNYLRMITPRPDEDTPQTEELSQEGYIAKATHCLKRGGMAQDEITRQIDRHKVYVKNRSFLQARANILREVSLSDGSLDAHLSVIDLPGHEDAVRRIYEQRADKAASADMRRAARELDDPHARLKHARSLIAAIRTCQEELHDLRMVRYHALRDLAATITLLFQLPQLREAIPERMHDTVQTILSGARLTPETYGIEHNTLQHVQKVQHDIAARARANAHNAINRCGMHFHEQEGGQVHIPVEDMVRWVDAAPERVAPQPAPPPSPAETQTPKTTLAPQPKLDRRRYAQAIHYATHLLFDINRPDVSLEWHLLPARSGDQAMQCRLRLKPQQEGEVLATVLRALPQSASGEGCQLHESENAMQLSFPIDKLAAVSTLMTMAHQLSHIDGIEKVALMPSGLGIEAEAALPRGNTPREQMEGRLQAVHFGLPVRRTPPLEDIFKGPSGSRQHFQMTLHPSLLCHQLPEVKTHSKPDPDRMSKAARIAAKIAAIPGHLRQRFIEGFCKPSLRRGEAEAPTPEDADTRRRLMDRAAMEPPGSASGRRRA